MGREDAMSPKKWEPKDCGYFHELKEKIKAALKSNDVRFELFKISAKHATTYQHAYEAVLKERKCTTQPVTTT